MSETTSTPTSAPVETSVTSESQGSTTQETKPLTASQKEKFMLTVDGEEFEDEVDFSDKEGLKKRFQLAAAAKKRMAEASDVKKKAFDIIKGFENEESFLDMIKKHPKGRDLAEKFLLAQIQDDMLSPEEKEMRMTKAELAKYKEKEAAENAKLEKSAQEKKEAHYAENFQKTIIEALNKSGLPKTPELVKRMASMMQKNLQLGIELDSSDLVAEVKKDITQLVKSIIGDSDGDHLVGLFGDDIAKKIRMADLKKLQEKQAQVFQRPQKSPSANSSNRDDSRPKSIEQWKEELAQKFK